MGADVWQSASARQLHRSRNCEVAVIGNWLWVGGAGWTYAVQLHVRCCITLRSEPTAAIVPPAATIVLLLLCGGVPAAAVAVAAATARCSFGPMVFSKCILSK